MVLMTLIMLKQISRCIKNMKKYTFVVHFKSHHHENKDFIIYTAKWVMFAVHITDYTNSTP